MSLTINLKADLKAFSDFWFNRRKPSSMMVIRKSYLAALAASAIAMAPPAVAQEPTSSSSQNEAMTVFHERIMPIFRSEQPSSCVQCHLSSVDLKDYIRPSHEETFAALRDQGLIDMEDPGKSKILELIAMGEQDPDRGAKLIHAKTRKAERDAFAAWIEACCDDPAMRSMPAAEASKSIGPTASDAVIRHARKDRLLDSFVRNVWSQRMRCYPCHTPSELDAGPKNLPETDRHNSAKRYEELRQQYGGRMDIFQETPEETMKRLIASSRRHAEKGLPLINIEDPRQSLLVLKPTAKIPAKNEDGSLAEPSSVIPVTHGGGLKMHVDDQSYKAFIAWIDDYAKVVNSSYAGEADLPADNWHPTEHVLRVEDAAGTWGEAAKVQLFVHRWDEAANDWEARPAAFTQGVIDPRGMFNGAMWLIGAKSATPTAYAADEQADAGVQADAEATLEADGGADDAGSDAFATLEPGKYLIKAYVDRDGRLAAAPAAMLDDRPSDSQTIVEATWRTGFRDAEVIEAAAFE